MQKVSKKRWLILLTLFLPFLFLSSQNANNLVKVQANMQTNNNVRHQNNFSYHDLELGMYNSGLISSSPFGEDLLFLWGSNISGQLGIGNTETVDVPQRVVVPEKHFKQLAFGGNDLIGFPNHVGLVTIDEENKNHLYMWGNNASGQIGDNSVDNIYQPLEIILPENNIKKIALGVKHSGVITTDVEGHDHLYMWGDNSLGALGTGDLLNYSTPKEIILPEKRIKDLSLGSSFTGVVTTDENNIDHLYMWGENRNGKIGIGNDSTRYFNTYQEVTTFDEDTIEQIALGRHYAGVITKDENDKNHLYMWGDNANGQVGEGSNTSHFATPAKIEVFSESILKDLNLGFLHTGLIATDANDNDHLYMWGDNWGAGLVGDTSSEKFYSPQQIALANNKIKDLSLGAQHSGIITLDANEKEEIYFWGDNQNKQIDFSGNTNYLSPTTINQHKPANPINIEIINEEVDTTTHKGEFTFSLSFDQFTSIFEEINIEDLKMELKKQPSESKSLLTWISLNNQNQLIGKVIISNLHQNTTYGEMELAISSDYYDIEVVTQVPVFTTKNFGPWIWIGISIGAQVGLAILVTISYYLLKTIFKKN